MVDPNGTIEIRAARPEDGPALMQAVDTINTETEFLGVPGERLVWADRATDELRRWQARNSAYYALALENDGIVGYLGAFAGAFARNRGVIWIGHVGLRNATRGRGVGRKLFAAMEDWARAQNAWRIELRVDTQNTRAQALYRHCGFSTEGTIPFAAPYGEIWHTHDWMGKLLGSAKPSHPDIDVRPTPAHDIDAVTFRSLTPEDADALCAWEAALINGTPLLLQQPQERMDAAAMQRRIAVTLKSPHAAEFAAFVEQASATPRIVAHGGIWVETQFRMAHDGNLGIAVLPEYSGRGIGRKLAALTMAWAHEKSLRRLSCTVMAHNRRGRRFAENLGFRQEVVCAQYAMIGDHAADRLRYGLLLRD